MINRINSMGTGASTGYNLQKLIAMPAQTDYTVTDFVLNPECIVYLNNVVQDCTISGQVITFPFSPEGGEIIKVQNVNATTGNFYDGMLTEDGFYMTEEDSTNYLQLETLFG